MKAVGRPLHDHANDDGLTADTVTQGDYVLAWTRGFSIPCAIVSEGMRLIWANGAAERLFDAGEVFTAAEGVLQCADRSQDVVFRDFAARRRAEPEAWALRRPDGAHIVVRAEWLEFGGQEPASGLMFHTTTPSRHVWADIGEIFGLTPAEVIIVKRMLAGASADEIAGALEISVETVRTHVRRIYGKIGASNREQLFSIVSPFRVG